MKKIRRNICLSIILFVSVFFNTQTSYAQHLDFDGVDIDGLFEEFVPSMETKGYVFDEFYGNIASFKGTFCNHECTVCGIAKGYDDVIHIVTVLFENRDTWNEIRSDYTDISDYLTHKYGNPSEVFDNIGNGFPNNGDAVLCMFKENVCVMSSTWILPDGVIILSVESEHGIRNHIVTTFVDVNNTAKIE